MPRSSVFGHEFFGRKLWVSPSSQVCQLLLWFSATAIVDQVATGCDSDVRASSEQALTVLPEPKVF